METPAHPRHTLFEDAQGILFGTAICALGLQFLTHSGLMTGQIAGLAILISYVSGLGFGPVFFVLNLPFYWIGYRRRGRAFMVKTFAAVVLLSVFSAVLPHFMAFDRLHPAVAALAFGLTTTAGLLALFRHGASLGGIGIVALIVQDRWGFQAGWFQMAFDAALFALALLWIDPVRLGWSLIGIVVLNAGLAINHRRDRYIAI